MLNFVPIMDRAQKLGQNDIARALTAHGFPCSVHHLASLKMRGRAPKRIPGILYHGQAPRYRLSDALTWADKV